MIDYNLCKQFVFFSVISFNNQRAIILALEKILASKSKTSVELEYFCYKPVYKFMGSNGT